MTITDPEDMDLQAALRFYAARLQGQGRTIDTIAQLMLDAAKCIDELEQRR